MMIDTASCRGMSIIIQCLYQCHKSELITENEKFPLISSTGRHEKVNEYIKESYKSIDYWMFSVGRNRRTMNVSSFRTMENKQRKEDWSLWFAVAVCSFWWIWQRQVRIEIRQIITAIEHDRRFKIRMISIWVVVRWNRIVFPRRGMISSNVFNKFVVCRESSITWIPVTEKWMNSIDWIH